MADLDEAPAYIVLDRAGAAQAAGRRIREAVGGLAQYPDRGRTGQVTGTRELVIAGTPFVAACRVSGKHVDVVAIMHGARPWLPAFSG